MTSGIFTHVGPDALRLLSLLNLGGSTYSPLVHGHACSACVLDMQELLHLYGTLHHMCTAALTLLQRRLDILDILERYTLQTWLHSIHCTRIDKPIPYILIPGIKG